MYERMKGLMLRYIAHKQSAATGSGGGTIGGSTAAASDSKKSPTAKTGFDSSPPAGGATPTAATDRDSAEHKALARNNYAAAGYWNARYSRYAECDATALSCD